jgi:tetratricopeptide (TPR) repeat protein
MQRLFIRFVPHLLAATFAGCAVVPPPATPEEAVARAPVSANNAVVALAQAAQTDVVAENYAAAAAALERALRIEPRNPRLWHELGRVKYKQGDYRQAANMAARANTWVGQDKLLRVANWRLIGEARQALGDEHGARAAFDKAEALAR